MLCTDFLKNTDKFEIFSCSKKKKGFFQKYYLEVVEVFCCCHNSLFQKYLLVEVTLNITSTVGIHRSDTFTFSSLFKKQAVLKCRDQLLAMYQFKKRTVSSLSLSLSLFLSLSLSLSLSHTHIHTHTHTHTHTPVLRILNLIRDIYGRR